MFYSRPLSCPTDVLILSTFQHDKKQAKLARKALKAGLRAAAEAVKQPVTDASQTTESSSEPPASTQAENDQAIGATTTEGAEVVQTDGSRKESNVSSLL